MNLTLFDLDNTLLVEDSDYLWGHFLIDQGLVDRDSYQRENERFYEDYKAGTLDIHAYQRFSLSPLQSLNQEDIRRLQSAFVNDRIAPLVAPATRGLLQRHRERGDDLVIITATSSIVTAPIAAYLEVPVLLATEPEFDNGRVTGEIDGTPCFQNGKIQKLRDWLRAGSQNYRRTWFYSDSRNDLPLLEFVDVAVAVDPDEVLQRTAGQRGWPIVSLRSQPADEVFRLVSEL